MITSLRNVFYFAVMAGLIVLVGQMQSWNLALSILNLCLISSVMALGVNMQWGYAGLFNVGVMGFAALGGLAAMLVSMPPVKDAWAEGNPCCDRLSWWFRLADNFVLASGRITCGCGGMVCRKNYAGSSLRLSRYRHTRNFRNHCRYPKA